MRIKGIKIDEDVARILNEKDNSFPPGSFAAWYGEDLSGQTYEGDLDCLDKKLISLFGCPSIVTGHFNCGYNKLTSLKGAPQKVGGGFYCSHNQLTSLEGSPKEVGDNFNCSENQLTSLEGAPEKVGGFFSCYDNQLTSLEGSPKEVGDNFNCRDNKLTSLEGAPEKVYGGFNCKNNQLTSLEGAPEKVRYWFDCSHNNLTSLEGAPEKVGKNFYCKDNPNLKSLDGIGEVKGKIISDIKDIPPKKLSTPNSNDIEKYIIKSKIEFSDAYDKAFDGEDVLLKLIDSEMLYSKEEIDEIKDIEEYDIDVQIKGFTKANDRLLKNNIIYKDTKGDEYFKAGTILLITRHYTKKDIIFTYDEPGNTFSKGEIVMFAIVGNKKLQIPAVDIGIFDFNVVELSKS